MLKAVIFDMDGVIIDSEPMHARAAILALKEYNIDISMEYVQGFIGTTTLSMCKCLIHDFHIEATPEELVDANNRMKAYLLHKEGHSVIPYITDLMKHLHEKHIKLMIASSSPSAAIEEVMESLHIKQYFQGYVSGTMVKSPKPAPDIFLLAAERLGESPDQCLVIEDSHHGVSAAVAAGMTCIGFINPNSGNQNLNKATMLVEGFEEVDYTFLNRVHQQDHKEPADILTTQNFYIKEMSAQDFDTLFEICMNPDISKYIDDFTGNPIIEKEKHIAYIETIYRFYGFGLWGVYDKTNNKLVGRCGIEYKQLDGENVFEIGYLLDQSYQGSGYATEFVHETINYCFNTFDIKRIIAIIDKNNTPSINLVNRIGMIKIGETTKNKRACDIYEITSSID